ncbi:hypothetical protein EXIGLDRAFT_479170 [Exidia glandulosa HHB12029]|uniref:Uncharacterized protein n=1 Tax=Exidia glandulosa HHB12029 TaxID=1314781 RepID=A0A166NHK9_EXIGL|nr:hypothetical protein EXIGLDRAFT_479170 [Exidia glandulosa HHB12029]
MSDLSQLYLPDFAVAMTASTALQSRQWRLAVLRPVVRVRLCPICTLAPKLTTWQVQSLATVVVLCGRWSRFTCSFVGFPLNGHAMSWW